VGTLDSAIRIRLIEEVPISEAGFRCLLEKEYDFKLLKPVTCESGCCIACTNSAPDILLMVMNSGLKCGLECISQIKHRNADIKILVLCMIEDVHIARRLLDLRVNGVICGHTPPMILFRAIRVIAAGGTYIDTNIAQSIALQESNSSFSPFSTLTLREFEIIRMMLDGLNQRQIGENLFISAHTVANHHANIMKKMGVSNHIELTKLAIRHGLITV